MLRVCIIDDERKAIVRLQQLLDDAGDVDVVGTFTRTSDILAALPRLMPDAVFVDIEMPGTTGLELAAKLKALHPEVEIVFTTAFRQYALEAFRVHALDYLMKPIDPAQLRSTLERLVAVLRGRQRPDLSPPKSHLPSNALPYVMPRMTIKLFRNFTITIGDREITPIRWRTTKAQELFMYLIQHRGQSVRKSLLIDILWPDLEPERALSQLYTSAYHIRKKLDEYSDFIQIISTKDSYLLKLQHVDLDVELWESAVTRSDALSEHKLQDLVAAMALNNGDYMQEFDYWWSESERYRLKVLWLRVSLQLVDIYMRLNQKELAEREYRNICLREPQAEEAHFALMKIWVEARQDVSVHNQYRILKEHLKEQYDVAPNSYITEWYEAWAKLHPLMT